MTFESRVPPKFWLDVFFTANFVINLLPTSARQGSVSLYERLFKKTPVYLSLRTFGSACYPRLRDYASLKDVKHMDVKHAFLHCDLTETVYMRQPAGFVDKARPDHVCLLHKSLHSLKQSPRAWYDKFSTYIHQRRSGDISTAVR